MREGRRHIWVTPSWWARLSAAWSSRRAVLLIAVLVQVTAPTLLASRSLASCRPGSPVDWSALQNPILSLQDAAVKDVAVVHADGRWRLLASLVHVDPFRFRIGLWSAPSLGCLQAHAEPDAVWDDDRVGGLASPDIVPDPAGGWIAAFNSHRFDRFGWPKLYWRRSADLDAWGPAQRLMGDRLRWPHHRLIDAALARAPFGWVLAYKRFQTLELARSDGESLGGPWRALGQPDTGSVENPQLLEIDGRWHMLATTMPEHRPVLFGLRGDPARPAAWLDWERIGPLDVPTQRWNRREAANAAYLVDRRATDGHLYLFYAGSAELDRFGGRGHAAVGVARSRDGARWVPAPEREPYSHGPPARAVTGARR